MIFVVAFFAIVLSAWVLAGFVSDALANKGRLDWLAVPAALLGSLLFSCVIVLTFFYLGWATSEPFHPVFGSWVVTSWAGILGVPLALAVATRIVVWEREDQEAANDG